MAKAKKNDATGEEQVTAEGSVEANEEGETASEEIAEAGEHMLRAGEQIVEAAKDTAQAVKLSVEQRVAQLEEVVKRLSIGHHLEEFLRRTFPIFFKDN